MGMHIIYIKNQCIDYINKKYEKFNKWMLNRIRNIVL